MFLTFGGISMSDTKKSARCAEQSMVKMLWVALFNGFVPLVPVKAADIQ